MEIKKVTSEMREALRKPLPNEAVMKHPTKTYLSSIKAIYVVERLNEVFGVGSWTTKNKVISVSDKGMVVVHSKLYIEEYGIRLESFGGNDNGGESSKNFDLGDAYKSACTDALTKMCSYLEIGISVFKGQGNIPSQPSQPNQTQTPPTPKEPVKPKAIIVGDETYNKSLNHLIEKGLSVWPELYQKLVKNNFTMEGSVEAELLKEVGLALKNKKQESKQ